MKSRLHHYLLALATLLSLSGFNKLVAQPYFSIDSILISPTDPTDIDEISIKIVGQRADSCSYLDSMDYAIMGFDLDIYMDWDSSVVGSCGTMTVPWDTTLFLGVRAAGTYSINLLGNNYADSSGHSLSFVVGATNAPCGSGSIIWVTTNADDGPGSLRDAIECANSTPGSNAIYFNIPGLGDHTINVGTMTGDSLPALTDDNTFIDGTTQPGYGTAGDFSPRIIISGDDVNTNAPINGLEVRSSSSGIYGLEIRNFPYNGIYVADAGGVLIGEAGKGNIIYGNGNSIDYYPGYDPEGPYEGNGIHFYNSLACVVEGNIIGTDESLTFFGANEFCGIFIEGGGDFFIIGGDNINEGNTIAFNPNGLIIEDDSDKCSIQKNRFYCNSDKAINFPGAVNEGIQSPMINLVTSMMVQGSAAEDGEVDVYLSDDAVCSNTPCQGYIYLGTATATAGSWSLEAPFAHGDTLLSGQQITAQLTDLQSNSSPFSICGIGSGISGCTDSIGQILVTNTNEFGPGSFYEALLCADTTIGSNVIKFDIPGTGPHIIYVGDVTGQALPAITDAGTIIDGTSQPGYGVGGNFTPQIILNGGSAVWNYPFDGLLIQGDYARISAIELVNFPNDAIKIDGADNCTISDNVIFSNGYPADNFPGAPGQGPFEGSGIVLATASSNNRIYNNYIGTDYTQTITTGNEYCGIFIGLNCDNNEIGGTGTGNVIANNAEGIRVQNLSTSVRISQNSIYCNDTIAIELEQLANDTIPAPEFLEANFTSTTYIAGFISTFVSASNTSLLGASIELYLNDNTGCTNAPCQGKTFLGSSPLIAGSWQLTAPFENGIDLENGDLVTAIFIDGDGNTSEFSTCYIVADCMLSVSPSVVDETCGNSNGSITFNTTGGPAPYSYDMGLGVQNSNLFENLSAGTYTVTVTDAYNCTTIASATITDSPLPSVSVGNEQGEICEMQNGSFIATGSSGTPPYLYDIGFGASGPNFFGLTAANYTVTITDFHGCTDTESVNIPLIPGPNLVVSSSTDETCSSGDGVITFNTSTGQPNFTYTIGFGNQSSPTFPGLVAGSYVATVTDDNGCTDTAPASIIDIPGPTMASTSNVVDANCGNADGSFTVTVDGGTQPYVYDIGEGPLTSPNLSGLTAGSYVVTVTDDNFCTITTSVTINDIPGPTISVDNIMSANCGQANGSITVSASSGTAPYVFNIGNGNQANTTFNGLSSGTYDVTVTDGNGCTDVALATVNDILGPSISISNQTDETCELANGSVSIFASGGTSPFVYNIGTGNTSSPTFNNLSAGDYTITVTDAANCVSLQPITITNTGVFPTASYMFNDVDGTVSFSNTTTDGDSYLWDFGDAMGSSTDPDPTYTYAASGTYNVCLEATNACGPHTYCELITVVVPPSVVTISGRLEKENGELVSTVDLECTGQNPIVNNPDGTFSFDMIPVGGDYEVDPAKDTLYGNGVSTFDVFIIQKHVLNVDTLESPYLIIASDVNNNGSVTTFDTYRMQQVILAIVDTFPGNESWRFVPKDYVFDNPEEPLDEDFPETLSFTNIQADAVNQDFIAIKVGDVTLNADPAFGPAPTDHIKLSIKEQVLLENETVEIEFNLAEARTLAAMQFELQFDPEVMELEETLTGELASINANNFGQRYIENGRLIFAWFDSNGLGQQIDTGTNLFKLKFKIKQGGQQLSKVLELKHSLMGNLAFEPDGFVLGVKTVFENSTSTEEQADGYELRSQPNPFSDYTQLYITLPKQEAGHILVYDISGKVLVQKEVHFQKGLNLHTIQAEDLPAKGMYYLQIKTEGFSETRKILFQ